MCDATKTEFLISESEKGLVWGKLLLRLNFVIVHYLFACHLVLTVTPWIGCSLWIYLCRKWN